MERTSIVIQARLGSTRLKNKILKKINGKTIIEIMMDRLSFSKYSKNIILAIPNNKENKNLYFFLKKKGFNVQIGDEQNVLKRFYTIAKKNNLKNIVRLTSDCPFIDYKIIELMAKKFFKNLQKKQARKVTPPSKKKAATSNLTTTRTNMCTRA